MDVPWVSCIAAIAGVAALFALPGHPLQPSAIPHVALSIVATVALVMTTRSGWRPALIAAVALVLLAVAFAALVLPRPPELTVPFWKRLVVIACQSAVPITTAWLSTLEVRRFHWPTAAEMALVALVSIALLPLTMFVGLVAYMTLGGSWP